MAEVGSAEGGFGFSPPDRGAKAEKAEPSPKKDEKAKSDDFWDNLEESVLGGEKKKEEKKEDKKKESVRKPQAQPQFGQSVFEQVYARAAAQADSSRVQEKLEEAATEEAPKGLKDGEEAGEKAPKEDAGASSSSASVFEPGCEVEIQGIKAKPELNGMKGKLVAFDAEKGRWQVQLPDGPPKLFKEDNLKLVPKAAPKEEQKRKPLPTTPLSAEETVEWINTALDEFEALMLPLKMEEDLAKIRKQYRQLSLLVHPDKCKHPDAEAAFKKMFGAMEVLSDPMKQRTALRKAKRKERGDDVPDIDFDDDNVPWWAEATVEAMEKRFREMEKEYETMGFFGMDRRVRQRQTGVDEDLLWISVDAAKDLFDKDLALFVDSRNTTDFDVSHVKGAKCLPGHTVEQLYNIERHPVFKEVMDNPEQNVIVYSDNGSKLSRCTNVANALRQQSSVQAARVLRLTGGLNAWKRMGCPVYGDARPQFAGQVLSNSMGALGGMDNFMMAQMMGGR